MSWQDSVLPWLPFVPALLLAFSVHESAHALAAKWLGDDTAAKQGRISLYPPRHLDLVGSIILPLVLLVATRGAAVYGYAKPTPVDPGRLRRPKRDFSLVALAGPLSNLGLAFVSAALAGFAARNSAPLAALFCRASLSVNAVLFVFNLLPLPGFDGMKALFAFMPDAWCWRLNRAGRWNQIALLALLTLLNAWYWLFMLADACEGLLSRAAGFPH